MGISAASHRLLPGVNQLLLTGKEWPGGDGKGRLSSEGLAAFPGFAMSSLEYPWPAHFTSVCLSSSGAAGSCPSPLCSHCPVSAGCLAHLILPHPSRRHLQSAGKGDFPLFGHFFTAARSRLLLAQGVQKAGNAFAWIHLQTFCQCKHWAQFLAALGVGCGADIMQLGEHSALASLPA